MYTPARLYQGQPGTSDTELYAVVGSEKAIVKQIVFANVTGSTAHVSVSLVPDGGVPGDANRICKNLEVRASEVEIMDLSQVIDGADVISAMQDTSGAITMTISGVVVS